MNAIQFLENQHREIESLFAQLEKLGDGRAKERKDIYAALALKIEHHARIEETIFYPQGRKADENGTLEAFEEHDVARYLARQLVKTRPADHTFRAKLAVLKKLVADHVRKEEQTYFPQCVGVLGEEKLLELGAELAAKYEKLGSSVTSKRSAKKAVGG